MTGDMGFIGTWVKGKLTTEGYDVLPLDRSLNDLTRKQTLKDFVSDASVVLHLAGKNRASDEELYLANTLSTVNLLQACDDYGPSGLLFLYASSAQVYKPTPVPTRIPEDGEIYLASAFANSKYTSEMLLRKWTFQKTLHATILRLSNVYGPGCRPYYNSVVATFFETARTHRELRVEGGNQTRDFIYVSDVVDAIVSMIRAKPMGFNVYNVSTGKSTSIGDLSRLIAGSIPSVRIVNDSAEVSSPQHLLLDPSKLERDIGFRAKFSIEDGLGATLASIRENKP